MQQNTNQLPNSEFLRIGDLCSWLQVKPSTVHAYCKKKLMPLPRKPFGLLIWSRQEIQMWLDSQV
jgi:predicted DNA-binding transcriptional regulator AlpA